MDKRVLEMWAKIRDGETREDWEARVRRLQGRLTSLEACAAYGAGDGQVPTRDDVKVVCLAFSRLAGMTTGVAEAVAEGES